MDAFCSVEEYRARYPDDETPDSVLAEALLEATDVISSAMDEGGVDYSDPSESFTYRLRRICRTVVRRSLGDGSNEADVPFGATVLKEGSAQFNASVQFANPYGDMFLTQQEKDSLGIGGGQACVMSAYTWPASQGGDP
jgi:hypothetical protein